MTIGKQATNQPFLEIGRLSDVIALIQVLSLDEMTHRSSKGIRSELQRTPRNIDSWLDVAREHPEFFRVNMNPDKTHVVSLISRHVTPKDSSGRRILNEDFSFKLMQLAIELHDREIKRSQSWHIWLPLIAAFLGGVLALLGVWFNRWISSGVASP